jgi:hypothetical protein
MVQPVFIVTEPTDVAGAHSTGIINTRWTSKSGVHTVTSRCQVTTTLPESASGATLSNNICCRWRLDEMRQRFSYSSLPARHPSRYSTKENEQPLTPSGTHGERVAGELASNRVCSVRCDGVMCPPAHSDRALRLTRELLMHASHH